MHTYTDQKLIKPEVSLTPFEIFTKQIIFKYNITAEKSQCSSLFLKSIDFFFV